MILISVLLIVLSIVLLWLGSIEPFVPVLVLIAGFIGLALELYGRTKYGWILHKDVQKYKAKWGGMFLHYLGLPVLSAQPLSVLITRKDEMLLVSDEFELRLPLGSIKGILSIRSDQVRRMSDSEVTSYLNLDSRPAIQALKNQMAYVSRFRRIPLILISYTVNEGDTMKKQMIALESMFGHKAIRDLLKRPEIRTKAVIFRADYGKQQ